MDVHTVQKKWGIEDAKEPDGKKILDAWASELGNMNQSCVVVAGDHVWTWGRVFLLRLETTSSLISLTPLYCKQRFQQTGLTGMADPSAFPDLA